jgi:predicted outer membrane protein
MTRWLLLMFAALPWLAQAQAEGAAVWRCGADGRSFSDQPCAGGRLVDVPAPRSAAEVAAAQAQAEQEKRFAERLTRERQQRDNVAPGTGLMGIKQPKVVQTSSAPTRLTDKTKVKRHKHRQRYAGVSLPA